jgi:hypothetical protein
MKKILYIAIILFSISLFGQQKRVTTTVDSTKVKMGAQINLTFTTTVDTLSRVSFPEAKFFGALEVLENYPTDTILEKDKYQLIKKYGLTQFDTGKYTIPRMSVIINNKPYLTDSIRVEIANVVVDTLKQKMYDIKDVLPAEKSTSLWWLYLLLAIVALIAISYFVYNYWKNKKPKVEIKEEEIVVSPIEKAKKHLQQLEKKDWLQKGEIKNYYSELTDIARTYIEEVLQVPAMESTTDELIDALKMAIRKKKLNVASETISHLQQVLQNADLVKFAKSKPLQFEIEEDQNKVKKSIFNIHKSIPEKIEEEEDFSIADELARKEALKRKKRKQNIIAGISIGVFVLVAIGLFLMISKGTDFIRNQFIGHPTKELLNTEWVSSAYGNPAIRIETPKVLSRVTGKEMDLLKAPNIHEIQKFQYGSLLEMFQITLVTATLKEPMEMNLEEALNQEIKILEAAGGSNVFVNMEDYQVSEGIEGKRASGTFTGKNIKGETELLQYQIIIFGTDKGFQEILLINRENDEFGKEIMKRIIDSIELGKPL